MQGTRAPQEPAREGTPENFSPRFCKSMTPPRCAEISERFGGGGAGLFGLDLEIILPLRISPLECSQESFSF